MILKFRSFSFLSGSHQAANSQSQYGVSTWLDWKNKLVHAKAKWILKVALCQMQLPAFFTLYKQNNDKIVKKAGNPIWQRIAN